jgi:xylose isomerase
MHFNDSYGFWDDDMIPGSVNFWRYVELFYQLKKIGYDGWHDLDIFPYREDPVRAVEQGISFIDYTRRQVDEHYGEIKSLVEEGDVHKTIDGLRKIFLRGYEQVQGGE